MMYRILNVRQVPGENFKVWYTDDYWDLFVWIDREKRISGFQLGYGKPDNERIFAWSRERGFTAMTVSDGEEALTENRTPVMVADTNFDAAGVGRRFKADSAKVNPKIVEFVTGKIRQFSR